MPKHRESSADRIWKEKLDECAWVEDAVVLLSFAAALVVVLIVGWP